MSQSSGVFTAEKKLPDNELIKKIFHKTGSLKVLAAAAVGGETFSLNLLAQLTNLKLRVIKHHLSTLESYAILQHDDLAERYSFTSETAWLAIYSMLPDELRSQYHYGLFIHLKQRSKDGRYPSQSVCESFHEYSSGRTEDSSSWRPIFEQCLEMGYDANALILLKNRSIQVKERKAVSDYYYCWGRWHEMQGDFSEASSCYLKAKDSDKSSSDISQRSHMGLLKSDYMLNPSGKKLEIIETAMLDDSLVLEQKLDLADWILEILSDIQEHRLIRNIVKKIDRDIEGKSECAQVLLSRIKGKMLLIENNPDRALELMLRAIEQSRKIHNAQLSLQCLQTVADAHFRRQDFHRSLQAINLAIAACQRLKRPTVLQSMIFQKAGILNAIGHASAASNLMEQSLSAYPNNKCQVFCLINNLEYCCRSNQSSVISAINEQLYLLIPSLDPDAIRKIVLILPDLARFDRKWSLKLLDICEIRMANFSEYLNQQLLPKIMYLRINGQSECLNTKEWNRLMKSAIEQGDFLSIAHLSILAWLQPGEALRMEKHRQYLEDNLAGLAFCPSLQADVLFCIGNHVLHIDSGGDRENEAMRNLIQSREIARRLQDQGRLIRAQNCIGSLIQQPSSDGSCGSSNRTLINAIKVAEDLETFKEAVKETALRILKFENGSIFETGDIGSGLEQIAWGSRLKKSLADDVARWSEDLAAKKPLDNKCSFRFTNQFLIVRIDIPKQSGCTVVLWTRSTPPMAHTPASEITEIAEVIAQKTVELVNKNTIESVGMTISKYDAHLFEFGIVGKSTGALKLKMTVKAMAGSTSSVHITGETGSGKELVARALHDVSPRKSGPFIGYNCASVTESLMESELFGHVKGAFTGAINMRKGIFSAAQGGTLFLDEIGDISPVMQAKFLRVLQEKKIRPVGSDTESSIDVRIISATNKNLVDEVKANRFRQDLFYRLLILEIRVPPLRERIEDIPILVEYFASHFAKSLRREKPVFHKNAMELLQLYHWPGNIRELQNLVEVAVNLAGGGQLIDAAFIRNHLNPWKTEIPRHLDEVASEFERAYIIDSLGYFQGNISKTAAALGISRQGLFQKMKRYSILAQG